VQPKLDLLARLQPQPSLLYWGGYARQWAPQVCFIPGAYANPLCRG
jgi:hypothetical protein